MLVVGPKSRINNRRGYGGGVRPEVWFSANDQEQTTNDALRPATKGVTVVSNGLSQQVDVNH
jgi:hypothetical protein